MKAEEAICFYLLIDDSSSRVVNGRVHGPARFLEIKFTDELLHHPYHSHREIFENGLAIGDTDPNRFIDTASVGQWPRFLEGSDVRLAQEIVGRLPGLIAPYFA